MKGSLFHFLLILLFCSGNISGQNQESYYTKDASLKNSIYIEFFGKATNGINITYERVILNKESFNTRLIAGFGHVFLSYVSVDNTYSTGFNFLFRKNKKINIEAGIIPTLATTKKEFIYPQKTAGSPCIPSLTFIGYANFGFRYNFWNGWLIRVNAMPAYYKWLDCESPYDTGFYNWGSVSFGKNF